MRLSINQACERSEKSNIARKASKGSMQCSKERKRLGSSCKAANGRGVMQCKIRKRSRRVPCA